MSQNIENKMSEKTVLIVFPSVFSLNKMDDLEESITRILKIKKHGFVHIRKNESLIVIETADPVLVSSTIGSLFGVDRIAIAKEVVNQFEMVLTTIVNTSMSLLLNGDKFYIKVEGNSPDYLPKDLEVTATANLIEKSTDLGIKVGSEVNHNRLLYTYLTKTHAYICIFVDRGLGGIPYNSQRESILCCMFDELSAIACLQSIKMGFDAKIVIGYSNDADLLKMAKMVNRILLSIVHEKITLYFCKVHKTQDLLMKTLLTTYLASSIAKSKKIKHVALPILPFVLPVWFVEDNIQAIFENGLTPWLPLSGMDASIIENSKQLGLERYLTNLESLCKLKFVKKNISKKKIRNEVARTLKSFKSISVTVGPKSVYDIIDSLRTNH